MPDVRFLERQFVFGLCVSIKAINLIAIKSFYFYVHRQIRREPIGNVAHDNPLIHRTYQAIGRDRTSVGHAGKRKCDHETMNFIEHQSLFVLTKRAG
jgi:hypothetical protein